MKHLIPFIAAALFVCSSGFSPLFAQTDIVYKATGTDRITGNLVFPSGKTLTIESGATINATGATITGFSAGLTVGTSAITSGTNGYALYNNNGTLGNLDLASLYQALDADLTDLADGSLTGSKVGSGIAAGNITSGSLADARLSSNIPRLNTSNAFAGEISSDENFLSVSTTNGAFGGATLLVSQASTSIGPALAVYNDVTPLLVVGPSGSTLDGPVTLAPGLSSYVAIGGASAASALRFLEPSGSGSNYASFTAPALAANTAYTLPTDDGDANQVLSTDGSGVLDWITVASGDSPAGSGSEIQYRSSGSALGAVTNSSVSSGAITLGAAEALGTTTAARLTLANTTAAAAGAQQVSPSLRLKGAGWKTTATAASQAVTFWQNVLPVQGSTAPTGLWRLQHEINDSGTPVDTMTVSSAGVISLANGVGGALVAAIEQTGGIVKVASAGTTAQIGAAGTPTLIGYLYAAGSSSSGALTSDGTGNLAMRGYYAPTTAQEFSIYNTDNGSNDELAKIGWRTTSNEFTIETAKTGTGSARAIVIKVNGTSYLKIDTDGDITFPNLRTTAGATGEVYSNGGVLTLSP